MPDQRPGWEMLRQSLGSLKTKILWLAVSGLVLTATLVAAMLIDASERNLLQARQDRQLDQVARAARLLSRRTVELERALRQAADGLDDASLASPELARRALLSQPVLLNLFSAVFIARPTGETLGVLEADGAPPTRLALGDRDYFRRTVEQARPQVSEALASRVNGAPVVVFTQPVVRHGQVRGVLGGTFRLSQRDVLVDLTELFESPAEALFVVTDRQGRMVAHPERERLLQTAAGETRLAPALAEWRSSGSPIEPAGLAYAIQGQRISLAGVPGPDWLVWHAVSEDDLLAPLRAARRPALLWAGGLTLLLAVLLAAHVRRLLQPLAQLQTRVGSMFAPAQDPEAGWPDSQDEIGTLAAALRRASIEHLRLEQTNQRILQRLTSVMEFAPVGLALTRGRLFEMVSPEMCRMFGRTEAELLGRPAQIIYASNEDYLAVGPAVQAAFEAGRPYLGQWQMLRANGTRLWVQLRGRPINRDDEEVGTIWSLVDISDEVQSRHHLEWTAHHDALTGLANRKAFEVQATRVMSASPRSIPAALLVIDLDHFKPINDQFGHAAGDDMLRGVAMAIGTCVRNNDLVVRYGGDEFVVLLERCSPKAAQRVAASVQAAIQAVRQVRDGHVLSVGASVGTVVLAEHHTDLAAWMAAADAACYASKAARRGAKAGERSSQLRLVGNEAQR